MIEQITVGVDGSVSALHATRWAATEAALRGVGLRLVHVREVPVLLPPTDFYAAELAEHGTKCLAAAEVEARAVAPTVEVRTAMRTGRPAEELVDETTTAGLVVVGSRGLGGLGSLLLGSVANSLTAVGRCPIVVMRGRTPEAPPPDTGPVVVGVDGTPASTPTLEFALAEAAARDADVLAVHAWTFDNLAEGWATSAEAVRWDDIAVTQHRLFEHQLATARETHPNVRVRSVHHWGHPAEGILDHAEDARLVVVGAHRHRRLPLGTVGSTSNAVLHHAICPVAVVPCSRNG